MDQDISRELHELVGLDGYISQLQAAYDRINCQARDQQLPPTLKQVYELPPKVLDVFWASVRFFMHATRKLVNQ